MRTSRWWRLLAVLFTISLVAASCGDDDSGDGGTAGGDSTTSTTAGEGGGATDAVAADESLDPVKIGLMNQENSPIGSFPEYRESVEAAAKFVNENTGGIDGHPIEIVSCVQASTEEAQACAQKLAGDGVVSVMNGINISTIGFDFYGTLGDIPVTGGTPLFPNDFAATNARYFYGGSLTVFGAMAQFVAQELGAKNVAILEAANPAGKAATDGAIVPIFDSLGVTYTRIDVPTPSTDVTPQVTQAAGDEFDAVLVLTAAAECGPVIQSANQLGIDPTRMVYTGTCNDNTVLDEFGDLAVGSYFHTTVITADSTGDAATDEKKAESEQINKILDQYNPDGARGAFATLGVQDVLVIEEVYDSIGFDGLSDPATIIAAFDDQEWNVPAGTSLRCGTWSKFPSVCNGDNYFPALGDNGERQLDKAWNVLDLIGN